MDADSDEISYACPKHPKTWVDRAFLVLFLILFADAVSFFCFSLALGGFSWSGEMIKGDYYVGNHGRLTKVSPVEWNINNIQAYSVASILVLLVCFVLIFRARFMKNHSLPE